MRHFAKFGSPAWDRLDDARRVVRCPTGRGAAMHAVRKSGNPGGQAGAIDEHCDLRQRCAVRPKHS